MTEQQTLLPGLEKKKSTMQQLTWDQKSRLYLPGGTGQIVYVGGHQEKAAKWAWEQRQNAKGAGYHERAVNDGGLIAHQNGIPGEIAWMLWNGHEPTRRDFIPENSVLDDGSDFAVKSGHRTQVKTVTCRQFNFAVWDMAKHGPIEAFYDAGVLCMPLPGAGYKPKMLEQDYIEIWGMIGRKEMLANLFDKKVRRGEKDNETTILKMFHRDRMYRDCTEFLAWLADQEKWKPE